MIINKPDYEWRYDPGRRKQTDYLILHHSAGTGSAESVHRYHRDNKNWAGIAYHYYVRLDGSIYEGRPEEWNGGHTRDYNYKSIGVCFEGNFEENEMPPEQIAAGRELVADIRKRYPDISVVRHGDVGATLCPGVNFPMDEILAAPIEPEKPSDYAAIACGKAVAKGIFLGDGQGNYNWAEPISRQDLCVVLDRLGLL